MMFFVQSPNLPASRARGRRVSSAAGFLSDRSRSRWRQRRGHPCNSMRASSLATWRRPGSSPRCRACRLPSRTLLGTRPSAQADPPPCAQARVRPSHPARYAQHAPSRVVLLRGARRDARPEGVVHMHMHMHHKNIRMRMHMHMHMHMHMCVHHRSFSTSSDTRRPSRSIGTAWHRWSALVRDRTAPC